MTNRDFRDLFFALNAAEVRYMVVGGYAVSFHARPRFTKDLGLWVEAELQNAQRTWRALAAYGAPVTELTPSDLANPQMVFQIGLPPIRIDILTSALGLTFAEAWERRVRAKYADCPVAYLSKQDLIENKRRVARPQDLEDVRALEES